MRHHQYTAGLCFASLVPRWYSRRDSPCSTRWEVRKLKHKIKLPYLFTIPNPLVDNNHWLTVSPGIHLVFVWTSWLFVDTAEETRPWSTRWDVRKLKCDIDLHIWHTQSFSWSTSLAYSWSLFKLAGSSLIQQKRLALQHQVRREETKMWYSVTYLPYPIH